MSILNDNDKLVFKILTGIFIVPFTALYLLFPFQAYMTLCKFDEYREVQGVDSSLVTNKRLVFDLYQGGFDLYVKYGDDPFMEYDYHYSLCQHDKEGNLVFDYMILKSVSGGNDSIAMDVCEHRPIDGMI